MSDGTDMIHVLQKSVAEMTQRISELMEKRALRKKNRKLHKKKNKIKMDSLPRTYSSHSSSNTSGLGSSGPGSKHANGTSKFKHQTSGSSGSSKKLKAESSKGSNLGQSRKGSKSGGSGGGGGGSSGQGGSNGTSSGTSKKKSKPSSTLTQPPAPKVEPDMTFDQKRALSDSIGGLGEDQLQHVVRIIQEAQPNLTQVNFWTLFCIFLHSWIGYGGFSPTSPPLI